MKNFDNSDKGLYNLIQNCVNEEEKTGMKIIKNEFYKKEKRDKEEKKKEKAKKKDQANRFEEDKSESVIESKGSSTVKVRKSRKRKVSEDNFTLNETQNILSNILQQQIDKDKKQLEKRNNSSSANKDRNINLNEDPIKLKSKEEDDYDLMNKEIVVNIDSEKEEEKKEEEKKGTGNINYVNLINESKVETEKDKDTGHQQKNKKTRGRPHKNFTSTIDDYFDKTVKNNLKNRNENELLNSEKLLQKKRNAPRNQNRPTKYKKKKLSKELMGYFNDNLKNFDNIHKSNETNLLEILFKEYGYNNIIFTITGNNENKIGENKMKKIRAGLNSLLGYEKNTKKIIETIVNMKKFNLIDDSCYAKGNRSNFRNKNRNNVSITSYHYHLDKDGYIYKFEVEKILKDGNVVFKCCDKKCEGKSILYTKQKSFKTVERHNLTGLEHNYIQNGYDKFQLKMELRNWNDIQLKKYPEPRNCYIEWHRTKYTYVP